MHSFSLNIFRRIPGHPNGSTQLMEFLPSIPQLIPVTVFCIVETQNFASPRFRVHPIDGFFYRPIFRCTNARKKKFRPSLKHRPKKDSSEKNAVSASPHKGNPECFLRLFDCDGRAVLSHQKPVPKKSTLSRDSTVIVEVPVKPAVATDVAVMVTTPGLIAVTTPELLTEALAVFDELQVTD